MAAAVGVTVSPASGGAGTFGSFGGWGKSVIA